MTRLAIALLLAAITLTSGCGKNDAGRVDVWGTVTWKGAPVPRGFVVFNPDSSQGNSGPQGTADIVDGKFDTRDDTGRGAVTGAVILSIRGYDGVNPTPEAPYGGVLFGPYEKTVDIPADGGELSIDVPAKP